MLDLVPNNLFAVNLQMTAFPVFYLLFLLLYKTLHFTLFCGLNARVLTQIFKSGFVSLFLLNVCISCSLVYDVIHILIFSFTLNTFFEIHVNLLSQFCASRAEGGS